MVDKLRKINIYSNRNPDIMIPRYNNTPKNYRIEMANLNKKIIYTHGSVPREINLTHHTPSEKPVQLFGKSETESYNKEPSKTANTSNIGGTYAQISSNISGKVTKFLNRKLISKEITGNNFSSNSFTAERKINSIALPKSNFQDGYERQNRNSLIPNEEIFIKKANSLTRNLHEVNSLQISKSNRVDSTPGIYKSYTVNASREFKSLSKSKETSVPKFKLDYSKDVPLLQKSKSKTPKTLQINISRIAVKQEPAEVTSSNKNEYYKVYNSNSEQITNYSKADIVRADNTRSQRSLSSHPKTRNNEIKRVQPSHSLDKQYAINKLDGQQISSQSKFKVLRPSEPHLISSNIEANNEKSHYKTESDGLTNQKINNLGQDLNLKNNFSVHKEPATHYTKLNNQDNNNAISVSALIGGQNIPITLDILKAEFQGYENTKCSMRSNPPLYAYAANTYQGIIRNYNEDRVSIILNISKPADFIGFWPKCSIFGIYDGHGGYVCADFLRDNLHSYVIKDHDFPGNPEAAIKRGFAEAESDFINKFSFIKSKNEVLDRSGSCALLALIIEDVCYISNVGDSRALLSKKRGSIVTSLSVDHKPNDPSEQSRIISNGGRIYQ